MGQNVKFIADILFGTTNFLGDRRSVPTITRRYTTSNYGIMKLNLPVISLKFKSEDL